MTHHLVNEVTEGVGGHGNRHRCGKARSWNAAQGSSQRHRLRVDVRVRPHQGRCGSGDSRRRHMPQASGTARPPCLRSSRSRVLTRRCLRRWSARCAQGLQPAPAEAAAAGARRVPMSPFPGHDRVADVAQTIRGQLRRARLQRRPIEPQNSPSHIHCEYPGNRRTAEPSGNVIHGPLASRSGRSREASEPNRWQFARALRMLSRVGGYPATSPAEERGLTPAVLGAGPNQFHWVNGHERRQNA